MLVRRGSEISKFSGAAGSGAWIPGPDLARVGPSDGTIECIRTAARAHSGSNRMSNLIDIQLSCFV